MPKALIDLGALSIVDPASSFEADYESSRSPFGDQEVTQSRLATVITSENTRAMLQTCILAHWALMMKRVSVIAKRRSNADWI